MCADRFLACAGGDLAGAEESYAEAIELDPLELDAYAHLGLLQQRRGELASAAASYRSMIDKAMGSSAQPRSSKLR